MPPEEVGSLNRANVAVGDWFQTAPDRSETMTSHGHDHTEPHVAVLPSYRGLPLTAAQRKLLTAAVIVVLAILIGWLLFLFPAYWD
jgi:hypothetical protein